MRKNKVQSRSKQGYVRIISGQWKGRKLPVFNQEGLRPTTDRMKETLFHWLTPYLDEARVLDVFAGTGSLAFEALSRYANEALLCEHNKQAAKLLQANIDLLQCQGAQVICADALQVLQQGSEAPYDIVFLDPPYRKDLISACVAALEAGGWLQPDSLLYLEKEAELQSVSEFSADWQLLKEKVAGQACCQLWVYRPLHSDEK